MIGFWEYYGVGGFFYTMLVKTTLLLTNMSYSIRRRDFGTRSLISVILLSRSRASTGFHFRSGAIERLTCLLIRRSRGPNTISTAVVFRRKITMSTNRSVRLSFLRPEARCYLFITNGSKTECLRKILAGGFDAASASRSFSLLRASCFKFALSVGLPTTAGRENGIVHCGFGDLCGCGCFIQSRGCGRTCLLR